MLLYRKYPWLLVGFGMSVMVHAFILSLPVTRTSHVQAPVFSHLQVTLRKPLLLPTRARVVTHPAPLLAVPLSAVPLPAVPLSSASSPSPPSSIWQHHPSQALQPLMQSQIEYLRMQRMMLEAQEAEQHRMQAQATQP